MPVKIDALPEKKGKISDSDLMVIEDAEDTKKITVKELRSALAILSDAKIDNIKEAIMGQISTDMSKQNDDLMKIRNAYYALARNYEYLNSSFNELKEKYFGIKTGTLDDSNIWHDLSELFKDKEEEENSNANTYDVWNRLEDLLI